MELKMRLALLVSAAVFALSMCGCAQERSGWRAREVQLTFDPRNHDLDNNDNFSPDDQWLVYDTRKNVPAQPMREIGGNSNIEKVNVNTGEIILVYETQDQSEYGPGVGAASYHPTENKVVVMHGLLNCDANRPYWYWRRTGVMVDESLASPCDSGQVGRAVFLDARDVTLP
ncbi:MAG: hypothetical protein ACYS4W_13465, partial [Planctomycetota bacterium]